MKTKKELELIKKAIENKNYIQNAINSDKFFIDKIMNDLFKTNKE